MELTLLAQLWSPGGAPSKRPCSPLPGLPGWGVHPGEGSGALAAWGCVCCSCRAAPSHTAPSQLVPPEATRQCPPGESLGTALHHLPSQQMRGAPGTGQPGMGVQSLACPLTRGVTGYSGNRAWPWGRRRSPVARVRLRGAARGAARSHTIRTPMLGPASSSLRLWGRLAPSGHREPRIPRCVTWGSSKHRSTAPPTQLRAPGVPHVPGPLLDASQPREPEAREQEVAEAWLPDSAEPVAEQRSPCSRRCSKPLDEESESLFWASAGSSRLGGQGGTPSQVSTQSGAE